MADSQTNRVLCAGNLVYDILVRPVAQVRWGATTWVDAIEQSMGGNGASTSYTLGKLGVSVRVVGMVGNDAFGEAVLSRLREASVDTSCVVRSRAPTAATVALVAADGARAFLHRPGSSAEAFGDPAIFDNHFCEGFSRFHLANPLGLPQLRRHAAEILRHSRAAGLANSIDTGWDSLGEWMQMLAPCLPQVDLMFVNQEEARMFTGCDQPGDAAAAFRNRGVGTVVVKLGESGCLVVSGEGAVHVPGYQVAAVDSTGAGDCFAGGFLAALEWGEPLLQAARFANAVGALSVQHMGATTGVRSRKETLDWVAHR